MGRARTADVYDIPHTGQSEATLPASVVSMGLDQPQSLLSFA